VIDAKGDAWLSFGSLWTGIRMRKLDRATGLLSQSGSQSDTKTYSLASCTQPASLGLRNPDLPPETEAVEAHSSSITATFTSSS